MPFEPSTKKSHLTTGAFLLAVSVALLTLHYFLFRDMKTVAFYLLFNLAVIPVEVIFVTLVIDRTIARREKDLQRNKLNMLVGLFYSELGNTLLKSFAHADPGMEGLCGQLHPDGHWQKDQFDRASRLLRDHTCKVEPEHLQWNELKKSVDCQKELLVSLITNPSLLENESFSHLLLSVFHLQEEFSLRPVELGKMDKADVDHLKFDIERAYGHLAREWVGYMSHLKVAYPYLYATACRNNPFGA